MSSASHPHAGQPLSTGDPATTQPTLFNRPPRVLRTPPTDEVPIPPPPQAPQAPHTMRMMAVVVPLVSAIVYLTVAAARGNVLSALPIIIIAGLSAYFAYDAFKRQRRDHEAAVAAYQASYQGALERTRQRLDQLTRQQRECYEENDPDLPQLIQIVSGDRKSHDEQLPAARLWERRPSDPDFLKLRMGRGDRPTSLTLKLPNVNEYNSDATESFNLAAQFQTLRNVPVAVDLRAVGSLGIAGPSGRSLNMLQTLLWQIVVHHSPSEVRIAAFWEATHDSSWEWLRWLPHTRPLDGDDSYRLLARYDRNPEDLRGVAGALSKELKRRAEDEQSSGGRPHLIVVMSAHHLHRDQHPIFTQCISASGLDVSAICLVPEVRDVPGECGGYIDLNHSGSAAHTRLGVAGLGGGYTLFSADLASSNDSEGLAKRLAPIELADVDGGREMPRNVPLLPLLGIEDAARYAPQRLWDDMPADSWHPVAVGRRSADEPLEINLNEGVHGVHGMIAGATGAGKSELLLSFLMALAIRHSPDRLNFLLVDFKGGATFRDLEDLPHTAGMVTDLSGYLAERALIAMNSELDRRKRLLAKHGVPNIRAYRKGGWEQADRTLPNLMIAIDEFDEMIRDYPQFQDELIRVSKQGRSLGVHLLFATQQPSLIKEGLQNNLSYWMSLRVNSREDSRAMVGLPDAALLGTDTPGRGYLRDKNVGVRMFQSALVTGLYRPSAGHRSREIDVTGHVRINTGETRALQMLQVHLDSLMEQVHSTGIKAQHERMTEQAVEEMLAQLDYIFGREPDSERTRSEGRILREGAAELQQAIRALPRQDGPDAEAEAVDLQIRTAASQLIERLMGDRPKISEIQLVARMMAEARGKRYASRLYPVWEEPLPSTLPLAELAGRVRSDEDGAKNGWLNVPYALLDSPEAASYRLVRTDLAGAGGNLLAIGVSGSGKTTLLHTLILALAAAHSPADLWFYIVDSAGAGLGLGGRLPHLADSVLPRSYLLVERLFVELQDQVESRRALFAQHGVASLAQYRDKRVRQGEQLPPVPPSIVVAIDHLQELIKNNDQAPDALRSLLREGRAYGIYFLVTAYTLRDVGNLQESFETVLALRVNSADDSYALIGKDFAQRLLKPDEPGRAFIRATPRPQELQIALPALLARKVDGGQTDRPDAAAVAYSDMSLEIGRSLDEIEQRWRLTTIVEERRPLRLRLLPSSVELATLLTAPPPPPACAIPLGVEGASLQPFVWALDQTAHLLVTGGPRTGKTTLLHTIAAAVAERYPDGPVELVLVDYSARALRPLAGLPQTRRFLGLPVGSTASKEPRDVTVVSDKDELTAIVQALNAELAERLKGLQRGLPLTRRTVLMIDGWDLISQDNGVFAQIEPLLRRGSDIGLHCVIAYTDPNSVMSAGLIRAARSSHLEIVIGRPVFDSASYVTAIKNRFKGVLAGDMPQGRAFALETGQVRLVQLALAAPDIIAAHTRSEPQLEPVVAADDTT